jgi:two-component system, NarL family, response regulator DevR
VPVGSVLRFHRFILRLSHLLPADIAATIHDTTEMDAITSPSLLKVYVVEDFIPVRERFVALLKAIDGVEIVGTAADPVAALAGIVRCRADVALVDWHLSAGTCGLAVLMGIAQQRLPVIAIVMTNFAVPEVRQASLAAGAHFFFDKTSEFSRVRDTVHRLAEKNRNNLPENLTRNQPPDP